jgi:hypothetical protein
LVLIKKDMRQNNRYQVDNIIGPTLPRRKQQSDKSYNYKYNDNYNDKYNNNQPNRSIICQDTQIWLKQQAKESIGNVVTGICDLDEIINLKSNISSKQKFSIDQYKTFFTSIAEKLMAITKPDGYCIFIQTDRKYEGQWIDKSYLLNKSAEKEGLRLLWSKVVLLREVGHTDLHRPTYSHMMCFSKKAKPGATFPDVIDVSKILYKNGTPSLAAETAIKFISQYSPYKIIVDPFVGQGTIVAYANAYGLDAVGIDIDPEQCQLAKDFYL